MRGMPWEAKSAAARARNPAQVAPFSSVEPRSRPAVNGHRSGMDVVEPDFSAAVPSDTGSSAAVGAPSPAVGDAPDLLDVHVHELPGPVAFVALCGGFPS